MTRLKIFGKRAEVIKNWKITDTEIRIMKYKKKKSKFKTVNLLLFAWIFVCQIWFYCDENLWILSDQTPTGDSVWLIS